MELSYLVYMSHSSGFKADSFRSAINASLYYIDSLLKIDMFEIIDACLIRYLFYSKVWESLLE